MDNLHVVAHMICKIYNNFQCNNICMSHCVKSFKQNPMLHMWAYMQRCIICVFNGFSKQTLCVSIDVFLLLFFLMASRGGIKTFCVELLKTLGLSILYIKATWCLSVWAVPGRFFQSLPVPCGAHSLSVVTNRAGQGQGKVGRPGQPLRGVRRGAISIKEILGENWGTCI